MSLTKEAVLQIVELVEDFCPRLIVRFVTVAGAERRVECEIRREGKPFTGVVWDVEQQKVKSFRLDLVRSMSICEPCAKCQERPAETSPLCKGCEA